MKIWKKTSKRPKVPENEEKVGVYRKENWKSNKKNNNTGVTKNNTKN